MGYCDKIEQYESYNKNEHNSRDCCYNNDFSVFIKEHLLPDGSYC